MVQHLNHWPRLASYTLSQQPQSLSQRFTLTTMFQTQIHGYPRLVCVYWETAVKLEASKAICLEQRREICAKLIGMENGRTDYLTNEWTLDGRLLELWAHDWAIWKKDNVGLL